jgi:hypothetical protein
MGNIQLSSSTFSNAGGAVSDLFAASGDRSSATGLRLKAQGDVLQSQDYDQAATLAGQNAQFTELSTSIKQSQLDRNIYQTIGGVQADTAGSGFAASGSSLDILRDSASQGALAHATLSTQGLITEAGYQEQQQVDQNLSKAALLAQQSDLNAADAADKAATGSTISGIFKGVAAVASIFAAPVTGGASLAATAGLDGMSAIH